jgi:DNA-binding transcriptional LysR family regulator
MSAELVAGRVVNIMPEFTPRTTELWIIYPSRQSITPTVRLLRDTFKQKCAEILKQLSQGGILL